MHDLAFEPLECDRVLNTWLTTLRIIIHKSGIMSFEEIRGAEQIASRSLVGMLETIELTRGRGIASGFATFSNCLVSTQYRTWFMMARLGQWMSQ